MIMKKKMFKCIQYEQGNLFSLRYISQTTLAFKTFMDAAMLFKLVVKLMLHKIGHHSK